MHNNGNFQFVNVSKPSQYLDPATRKIVRRNATLFRSRKKQRPRSPNDSAGEDSEKKCSSVGVQMSLFPIEMQQYMYDMLHYTEKVMGPELFPLESIYPYHPGHRFEMRLAFQDAKVMNTVVAIASFRYALENKAQFFVDAGLRHQGQALRLVKESLTNGDPICDAGTVLCIAQLACLELFFGDAVGWQTHIDGLRTLCERSKASSNLSLIQFTVTEIELLGCYMFDRKPTLNQDGDSSKVALSLPSPFTPPSTVSLLHRALHQQHHTKDEIHVLDEEVVDIILEMQDLSNRINQPAQISNPERRIITFLSARTSTEYRLMRQLDRPEINDFSKAVCFAAQIYVNKVFRTFWKGTYIPHRIAERLKKAIMSTLDGRPKRETFPAGMLWMAFMGGIGAQVGPLRLWFTNLISYISSLLELKSWFEIQLLLSLWQSCESAMAECKALWEEVGGAK